MASRPSLSVAAGVALLSLGVAVLVVLALQSPPPPENAGAGVTSTTPEPTADTEPPATATPRPEGDRVIAFIGDTHLDDWAADAAQELGATAEIEAGVTLFEEPAVTDVLEGPEPDIAVLSIGAADVVWADDFQFGLRDAVEAVRAAWPEAQVVLMRPAWPTEGDLEREKNEITEQVAAAQDAVYLDADPTAADFLRAWSAAGL